MTNDNNPISNAGDLTTPPDGTQKLIPMFGYIGIFCGIYLVLLLEFYALQRINAESTTSTPNIFMLLVATVATRLVFLKRNKRAFSVKEYGVILLSVIAFDYAIQLIPILWYFGISVFFTQKVIGLLIIFIVHAAIPAIGFLPIKSAAR